MKKTQLLALALIAVGCGPPPDGPYEEYYDTGQLMERGTYENGRKHGPYEGYYENGQLAVKGTYRFGRYDGPIEQYYDTGQLMEKAHLDMGVKGGSYWKYSGYTTHIDRLESAGVYRNGVEYGVREWYDWNGQLASKGAYRTGSNNKCGQWIEDGEAKTYSPCRIIQAKVPTQGRQRTAPAQREHGSEALCRGRYLGADIGGSFPCDLINSPLLAHYTSICIDRMPGVDIARLAINPNITRSDLAEILQAQRLVYVKCAEGEWRAARRE